MKQSVFLKLDVETQKFEGWWNAKMEGAQALEICME